jgi:ADP-heptose:LPS heptosyltransferase
MNDKSKKELLARIQDALKNRRLRAAQTFAAPPPKKVFAKKPAPKRDAKGVRPARPIPGNPMLLTGGIGDVLTLESFLTADERAMLPKIYYATQKRREIERLFAAVPCFPALKVHDAVWDDFSKFWCFYSKAEVAAKLKAAAVEPPPDLRYARDFSILEKFKEIHAGRRAYTGSSFLNHTLADVGRFALPTPYAVVCPYSSDKRNPARDFDAADWAGCLAYLKATGLTGVVVNAGKDKVPASDLLVDLSNQTTITEAVEVLKVAAAYVGIDSCLSVLAAKLFFAPNLIVKSVSAHCHQNAKIYYAPQTDFGFMVRRVEPPAAALAAATEGNAISLNVCQGVGDIFWVYQKFAPHVDAIDFNICQIPSGAPKLQTRAVDFLRLLPKVRAVTARPVSAPEYERLTRTPCRAADVLKRFEKGVRLPFDYCCNPQLERGVRLEDIDPDYAVEETVPIRTEACPLPFAAGEYVALYVSGSTLVRDAVRAHKLWGVGEWADFAAAVRDRLGLDLPVVLVGASYDERAAREVAAGLAGATEVLIDLPPAQVAHVIKNSRIFLNYQSGLSILADNMGVEQVMIYFPYLRPMLYTWCKKAHVVDGTFRAYTFDTPQADILDDLVKTSKSAK